MKSGRYRKLLFLKCCLLTKQKVHIHIYVHVILLMCIIFPSLNLFQKKASNNFTLHLPANATKECRGHGRIKGHCQQNEVLKIGESMLYYQY